MNGWSAYPALAAAAALSAFDVPGRFDADDKLPNRLVGFGATMLALGRDVAAAALLSCPVSGRLAEPALAEGLVFFGCDVTMRFEPGSPLVSVSRGRLDPASSPMDAVLGVGLLRGGSSLGGESCFRLVEAAALSKISWDNFLTAAPPFLENLGNNLATLVFWRMSSSMVVNRASSCGYI